MSPSPAGSGPHGAAATRAAYARSRLSLSLPVGAVEHGELVLQPPRERPADGHEADVALQREGGHRRRDVDEFEVAAPDPPLQAVGDLELPHPQAERAHEGDLHVGVVERGRLRGVELQPVHELTAADVTIQDQLGVGEREPGRVGGRRVQRPLRREPALPDRLQAQVRHEQKAPVRRPHGVALVAELEHRRLAARAGRERVIAAIVFAQARLHLVQPPAHVVDRRARSIERLDDAAELDHLGLQVLHRLARRRQLRFALRARVRRGRRGGRRRRGRGDGGGAAARGSAGAGAAVCALAAPESAARAVTSATAAGRINGACGACRRLVRPSSAPPPVAATGCSQRREPSGIAAVLAQQHDEQAETQNRRRRCR